MNGIDFKEDRYKTTVEISIGEVLELCFWAIRWCKGDVERYSVIGDTVIEELERRIKTANELKKRIEITLKNGETIAYPEGDWDDYSFDKNAIAVKNKGVWVGIYNFDNVALVEIK